MSTVYAASAVRFLKQYRAAAKTPTHASLSAASEAARKMRSVPWAFIDREYASVSPGHEEPATTPEFLDIYDAYLTCAEHAGSMHRAYAGMAAYRIELPDAAAGLLLESLSVSVSCDPYTRDGARLSVATSAGAAPSTDWDTQRAGSASAAGVAPRTMSSDLKIWYGATATATLAPAGGLALQKYLWVYLSLENYARARNGWLEGSASLVPTFTLTLSDVITGYEDVDEIGGGYELIAPPAVPVISGGAAFAPLLPDVLGATREIAAAGFVIGAAASRSLPPSADAVTALGPLFARVASGAAAPLDVSVLALHGSAASGQAGLSAAIVRRVDGASGPFTQILAAHTSPLAAVVSFLSGRGPSMITVRNTLAAAVEPAGADVRLDIWWAPTRELTLAEIGAAAATPEFWFADGQAGPLNLAGSCVIPASLAAGADLAFPVAGISDRWGTLVAALRIVKVTAAALEVDVPVGLPFLQITRDSVSGNGWVPDITLS